MNDGLGEHHSAQRKESLKLQNEVESLKKEVSELYQRILELTRRLNDMEFTVGQDEDVINKN